MGRWLKGGEGEQVGTLAHTGGLIDTVSELVLDSSLGPPGATLRGEELMIDAAWGQDTGTVLAIRGLFLAVRFPHDDWYVLPALETAYYAVGAYCER